MTFSLPLLVFRDPDGFGAGLMGYRVECPCIRVRVAGVVGRVLKPTEVQRPSARVVAKRLCPRRRWCDLDRPAKVAFPRSSSAEGLSAFGYRPL